jgi:hypothetical protein
VGDVKVERWGVQRGRGRRDQHGFTGKESDVLDRWTSCLMTRREDDETGRR